MTELHKEWLIGLYENEIAKCKESISNNTCDEEHTENVEEYIDLLEGMVEELNLMM